MDDWRGWELQVALYLLSLLSVGGYFTRAASSLKRVGAVVLQFEEKKRCSVLKNLLPGGSYIQVCVYVCIYMYIY